MEEYRPIKGYEDKYFVSNMGNVMSVSEHRKDYAMILKQYKHVDTDYLFVRISKGYSSEKKRTLYKNFDVHRLVAEAFLQNPDGLPCVNHKDENKQNNRADNLEWCTAKYNSNYGTIKEKQCKKVCQYNKEGELIGEHSSVHMAASAVDGSAGNISSCCVGRIKTAYGFVWKYA